MKKVRLDRLGRLVVPIQYRKALGINDGDCLIVSLDGGKICVTPERLCCRLCGKMMIQKGNYPVCDACAALIKNEF